MAFAFSSDVNLRREGRWDDVCCVCFRCCRSLGSGPSVSVSVGNDLDDCKPYFEERGGDDGEYDLRGDGERRDRFLSLRDDFLRSDLRFFFSFFLFFKDCGCGCGCDCGLQCFRFQMRCFIAFDEEHGIFVA